jgi:Na+/citrate or Na+/malate symporter
MSESDIPTRFAPAAKWVVAGIVLFVVVLGVSDSLRDGDYRAASIYGVLFVLAFIIAVKWDTLTKIVHKAMVAYVIIALGAVILCLGAYFLGQSNDVFPKQTESTTALVSKAHLSLMTYGDDRTPTRIGDGDNIWR